jgi:hypothetical protein
VVFDPNSDFIRPGELRQDASGPDAEALAQREIRAPPKFGLWLLLSTQRPSKVHSGIISQCDNLALMK